jgi:hypothetical protein
MRSCLPCMTLCVISCVSAEQLHRSVLISSCSLKRGECCACAYASWAPVTIMCSKCMNYSGWASRPPAALSPPVLPAICSTCLSNWIKGICCLLVPLRHLSALLATMPHLRLTVNNMLMCAWPLALRHMPAGSPQLLPPSTSAEAEARAPLSRLAPQCFGVQLPGQRVLAQKLLRSMCCLRRLDQSAAGDPATPGAALRSWPPAHFELESAPRLLFPH